MQLKVKFQGSTEFQSAIPVRECVCAQRQDEHKQSVAIAHRKRLNELRDKSKAHIWTWIRLARNKQMKQFTQNLKQRSIDLIIYLIALHLHNIPDLSHHRNFASHCRSDARSNPTIFSLWKLQLLLLVVVLLQTFSSTHVVKTQNVLAYQTYHNTCTVNNCISSEDFKIEMDQHTICYMQISE